MYLDFPPLLLFRRSLFVLARAALSPLHVVHDLTLHDAILQAGRVELLCL